MLINPKFSKYIDYNRKIVLREGIEGITPYHVTLPEPPKPEQFINYGLPISEQFFKREPVPAWLPKLNKLAKQKSLTRDYREEAAATAHRNKEMREYIADKWRKRNEGIYIFIKGVPVWIPGNMWFYLNYYHIFQHGLPDFRYADVEWWYWWNICVNENPLCYGGIEMAARRDGKTSRFASNFIEQCTRLPGEQLFGFIGRSKDDSKKAFLRAYVIPLRKLPFFFTPHIDSVREYQQNEIHFRDSKNVEHGLLSRMDQRPTVTTAYDGEPLTGFHGNEWGKVSEMMVSECWDITKECLQVQGRIRGKGAIESTIEEMNVGGMDEFIKIFLASDNSPDKLVLNQGRTESGMLPYYRPGYEIYVVDQYGFSITEEPTEEQAEYLKKKMLKEKGGEALVKLNQHRKGGKQLVDELIAAQKDPIKKQALVRRYSRTIREAFRKDAINCHFNLEIIENRLSDFLYGNKEVIGLKLNWKNQIPDTIVEYRIVQPANPEVGFSLKETEGLLLIKKNLWEYLEPLFNNVQIRDGWRIPGNKNKGIIVADPYKYDADATESDRKSLGAAHAFLFRDPKVDPGEDMFHWKTGDLFAEFTYRGGVDEFDEYMMMISSLFGMKFSPETNSGDMLPQFSRRRYDKFMYFEPKVKVEANIVTMTTAKNAGFITMGDNTRIPLYNAVDKYIDLRGHQCVFPRFLENCKDVEYKKETKYDHFISGGNAIRIAEKMEYKRVEPASLYVCHRHPEVTMQLQGECPKCGDTTEKFQPKGFQGLWKPTRIAS